jgi:microcystin-dependent protein
MSSPFVAEIKIFAGNFAPTGWAECNGQLMPISQNTALFSLLGTFYGGDGKSTFALPDLQGAAPMHWGQGAGLTPRDLGETAGEDTVTLLQTEMPLHNHNVHVANNPGTTNTPDPPAGFIVSRTPSNAYLTTLPPGTATTMSPFITSIAGASLPHNNLQPYLVLMFIIALQGIFPARP